MFYDTLKNIVLRHWCQFFKNSITVLVTVAAIMLLFIEIYISVKIENHTKLALVPYFNTPVTVVEIQLLIIAQKCIIVRYEDVI